MNIYVVFDTHEIESNVLFIKEKSHTNGRSLNDWRTNPTGMGYYNDTMETRQNYIIQRRYRKKLLADLSRSQGNSNFSNFVSLLTCKSVFEVLFVSRSADWFASLKRTGLRQNSFSSTPHQDEAVWICWKVWQSNKTDWNLSLDQRLVL